MFPSNQNFLSANAGLSNGNNPCFPMYLTAAPTSQTIYAPYGVVQVGQIAVVPAVGAWICLGLLATVSGLTATWEQFISSSGDVLSVTGTTNQITANPTTGNVILTIPTTFISPGSIASTTTNTAGTGFIATTGNLTLSGVGSGFVTTPTVVTAAASPQTANGRVFSVAFSSVSIASGATQTFTITNSSITGSSTVVDLKWFGSTAGSALSIESITPSAGSLAIVMTNGTSATMVTSTANITFVGIVLN
jgi:hypothetical protein